MRAVPESPNRAGRIWNWIAGWRLRSWGGSNEAERTFEAGHAGIRAMHGFWKRWRGLRITTSDFRAAKKDLRRALVLDPNDAYANNFLASIYFLEAI